MRTIYQGVSVLLTFGSSFSSHLYCGVYFPEKMEDYCNKRDTTLKTMISQIMCAFNPSSNRTADECNLTLHVCTDTRTDHLRQVLLVKDLRTPTSCFRDKQ